MTIVPELRVLEALEFSPARGKAKGRLSLRRNLFALAAKGNPAANIFLAKNLLGYRDYFRNEHSGPDGVPLAIAADLSRLTTEELFQLEAMVKRLERKDPPERSAKTASNPSQGTCSGKPESTPPGDPTVQ